MNFDEVLPAVVGVVEQWPQASLIRRIAVVRDLRGRIRLAISLDSEERPLLDELVGLLRARLGAWFTGDVLSTDFGDTALRKIAQNVVDKLAPAWPDPTWRDATGIEHRAANPSRWRLLERRMGKLPWLEGRIAAPWSDDERLPTVVTFFSFKGGVGRTTTLASCALQAARSGERVALIDLDLEAPGLASLFGVTPDRGVLDLLVEHLATGDVDVGSIHQLARGLPDDLGDLIHVFPAGRLDTGYLEKLSRLDFSGAVHDGEPSIPVHVALRAILQKVCDEFQPRWIFLDARAGLHDLAGLSLHGLAHLDVIFSRANAQGIAGLDIVLSALARRQRDAADRICLVHALAPAADSEATAEQARLREATYAMFQRHNLFAGSTPEQSAEDADHNPLTLQRAERIERNDRLADIMPELDGRGFQRVWERIKLLAQGTRQTSPAQEATP